MTEKMAIQVARICERAQNELLASLQSIPAERPTAQPQDWMSAIQLAEYWQLDNDKNEPPNHCNTRVVKAAVRSLSTSARLHR